jgi:hypothetical protein
VVGRSPLPQLAQLPRLTAGPIQNIQSKSDWRGDPENLRRLQDPNLKQLNGLVGIRESTELPQVVTDLLILHARTLAAEEHDSYIVNPKLAEEWIKTNQLPPEFVASVRKAALDDGKRKKKGCSSKHLSTGCVKNEVEQSVDDLTNAWRDTWTATADELGRLLGRADDVRACFADRTLTLSNIPVRFAVEPEIPLSFEKDGTSERASGTVKGTVAVGIPVNADFTADVKMYYIPCLPFAVRPRSLGASGRMDVGGSFTASVNAAGKFDQSFSIPPGGGIQVPIAVLPIALGGVPIAVLDISVYLDGTLAVSGEGALEGTVKLQAMQNSSFAFECTGHGCQVAQRSAPAPATALESVKLDGRIRIKPAIYSALQLSLNYNLLSARAGPQPFLLGEIYGCAAASGTQSSTGASSKEQSYALTADLDWGLDLRAEAVAGGKKVAGDKVQLMSRHIYFKDLAQSTGLTPGVAGTLQPSLGQPAAYAAAMPRCYPYPEDIQYRVQWTGGAVATTGAPSRVDAPARSTGLGGSLPARTTTSSIAPSNCTWQAGQGTCWGNPLASTALNLTWPTLGDFLLTVTPIDDKHGRKFEASRATQLNIKVQQ